MSPKVTTERTDILRETEIKATIDKAGELYGVWFQSCLSMAWIFGKRISEILNVKREDCDFDEKFLYVRFIVLKKHGRRKKESIEAYEHRKIERERKKKIELYLKKISVKHPFARYIIKHLNTVETGYLFTIEGRRASRFQLHRRLKKCNPNAWFHLFRHSLATIFAERGATETELMAWFDWISAREAHGYVVRGPKLTERLSKRTW